MNHFLSFIAGDFDNFSIDNYKNSTKVDYKLKCDNLKSYFNNIGFKNIRFSERFDISENPNDNFFYFVTDIVNFDIDIDSHDWNSSILKSECMDYLINNENCYLVFIHDSDEIKSALSEKIALFSTKFRIAKHKIISTTFNELNYDFVNTMISNVKQDTFNIVYEDWSEDGNKYYPNLSQHTDEFRYRVQVGLFRFYNLFYDVRAVHIDEVKKHEHLQFYYFINGDQLEQHFKKNNRIPLTDKVRELFLTNKNFSIIILNEHEYENENFIVYLNQLVLQDGYDPSRFYLMTNNSKLDFYKEKHKLSINVYSLDFLVMFIATHMVEFGEPEYIEDKTSDFFMCHNRGPKSHRYGLLCMLKKHNLLDQIDWSLILGWYRKNQKQYNEDRIFYNPVFNNDDLKLYEDEIKFFGDIEIKKSKYETEKTWFDDRTNGHIEWKEVYEYQTYQNTYVNIVTESCYNEKEIHITEKSIKPFYFYQFPLFLSSYNHVKYLKDRFGFDMFDDIIDHSYDNEPDNRLRLIMFFDEIKRLSENKEKLIEFYKNNKARFIYNKDIVVKIKNSNRDAMFFKNLIKKR